MNGNMTTQTTYRSSIASAAGLLGLAAVGIVLIGLVGASTGLLPPLAGFAMFGLGMTVVPLLGSLLGLVGLLRTRAGARLGRERAWLGVGLGGLLFGSFIVVVLVGGGGGVPAIHDITTSPDRPPQYLGPAAADRDLTYPHGGPQVTALQLQAYVDLAPVRLEDAPPVAYARALAAAEGIGLSVLHEDAAGLRFEATDTSRVFRFVDDFSVEIESDDATGSVVHVRSTSRVGQSDLGANAERIRRFVSELGS